MNRVGACLVDYPLLQKPHMRQLEDVEDILNKSLAFLGSEPVIDNDVVHYGQIRLRIAPKVSECRFAAFTS